MMCNRKFQKFFISMLLVISLLVAFPLAAFAEEAEEAEASARRFLFAGNSLVYYNNSVEMLQRMAKTGMGEEVEANSLFYGKRRLAQHVDAIVKIIETEGDSSRLKPEDREIFHGYNTPEYSEDIYQGYAAQIWDAKNHCPVQYDEIILQPHLIWGDEDTSSEKICHSLERLVNVMAQPDADYVVCAPSAYFYSTFEQYAADQDRVDEMIEGAVRMAKKKLGGKCRDIRIWYYGRALCNYLFRYGDTYAQELEPAAFEAYYKRNLAGILNDVFYGDLIHPTQLGSYIITAALYSLLYDNPEETLPAYRASIEGRPTLLYKTGLKHAQLMALRYNKGKGLRNNDLLLAGANIGWETQRKGMHLEASDVAKKPPLKKTKSVQDGVRISWKGVKGSQAYRVFREKDNLWKEIGETKDTHYVDAEAQSGEEYNYTVCCLDQIGGVETSTFNVDGIRGTFVEPPQIKTAVHTPRGVKLTWDAPEGVHMFRVYRRDENGWEPLRTTYKTFFTDTTAKPNQTYLYSVRCMEENKGKPVSDFPARSIESKKNLDSMLFLE